MKFKIIILISALSLLTSCHSSEPFSESKPLWVHTTSVQEKDLVDTIELTGTVNPEPNQSATVAAVTPGLLTMVSPKIGDWVLAGQTVARIQQSVQNAQRDQARAGYLATHATLLKTRHGARPQEISQAQANLRSAQANLDNTRKNLARMQTLVSENIAAGKDVDAAVNQQQVALAQVQTAQDNLSLVLKGPRREDRMAAAAQDAQAMAALDQAQATLNLTQITSPISGYVVDRYL